MDTYLRVFPKDLNPVLIWKLVCKKGRTILSVSAKLALSNGLQVILSERFNWSKAKNYLGRSWFTTILESFLKYTIYSVIQTPIFLSFAHSATKLSQFARYYLRIMWGVVGPVYLCKSLPRWSHLYTHILEILCNFDKLCFQYRVGRKRSLLFLYERVFLLSIILIKIMHH